MTKLRTSVRNTFLDVEVTGPPEFGGASFTRGRSMSDEFCFSVPPTADQDEAALEHLDELINSPFDGMQKWANLLDSPLKKAPSLGSVSSVSTMAVEDWDRKLSFASDGVAAAKGFQHCLVPKNLDFAREVSDSIEAPTTLMIRNIPNRYTQDELIDELERLGLAGSFDFFYAPIDVGTMACVGYAFVNFVHASWLLRCQQVLAGYVFARHQKPTRQRVATVSIAHLQGLEANLRHYEKSAVSRKARAKRSGPVVMTAPVERSESA